MKNKQYGISLVSLLIGLLISMLCLLALLAIFRTVVQTSVDSRKGSDRDTNVQNSLMGVQSMIQSAGFGLTTDGTNLLILDQAISIQTETNKISFIDSNTEQTVLWRYKVDSNITCEGVSYSNKQLIFLTSSSCPETNALKNDNWEKSAVFADFTKSNVTSITFTQSGTCIPYGFDGSEDASYPKLTITATYPLDPTDSDSTTMTANFPVCLTNPVNATSS